MGLGGQPRGKRRRGHRPGQTDHVGPDTPWLEAMEVDVRNEVAIPATSHRSVVAIGRSGCEAASGLATHPHGLGQRPRRTSGSVRDASGNSAGGVGGGTSLAPLPVRAALARRPLHHPEHALAGRQRSQAPGAGALDARVKEHRRLLRVRRLIRRPVGNGAPHGSPTCWPLAGEEGPRPSPEVARAWQLVIDSSGAVPIGRIANEVGWSHKHLIAARSLGSHRRTICNGPAARRGRSLAASGGEIRQDRSVACTWRLAGSTRGRTTIDVTGWRA
jgi:hypothetical protein